MIQLRITNRRQDLTAEGTEVFAEGAEREKKGLTAEGAEVFEEGAEKRKRFNRKQLRRQRIILIFE